MRLALADGGRQTVPELLHMQPHREQIHRVPLPCGDPDASLPIRSLHRKLRLAHGTASVIEEITEDVGRKS